MATLNTLSWLRNILVDTRRWYYNNIWGMHLHPTCTFSLSVKFDLTYPKGVYVGEETYIAFDVAILAHDRTRSMYRDTHIGKRCFIGARSIIMPGVNVGDCCIVGAGSIVTKDVPSNTAVAGNPARVIREEIQVGPYGRLKKQP